MVSKEYAMNKKDKKIENRLKELRKKNKETQADIADLLQVNVKTVSRWESGESSIRIAQANMLAEHFNVNVEYLLGESVYKNPFDQLLSIQGNDLGNGMTAISQEDLNKIPHKDSFMNFLKDHDLALSNDDIDKVIDLIKLLSDTNKKILNNFVTDGDIEKLEELKDGDFSNLFTYSSTWSNKYNSLKNTDN